MLTVAIKESSSGRLLVITDSLLLGKRFEEGRKQLDLAKAFYQGEEQSAEEIRKIIMTAKHLHFTGKEAVALGIELDLIASTHILYVQKIPHAEVVMSE